MPNYGNIRVAFTGAMRVFEEVNFDSKEELLSHLHGLKKTPSKTTVFTVGGKIKLDHAAVMALGQEHEFPWYAQEVEKAGKKSASERAKSTGKLQSKFTELKSQVAFSNEEDEKTTTEALKKLIAGEEVSKQEIETFNKYVKLKKAGNGEVSFYMASKEPGNFKQNSRLKIELGSGATANAFKKELEDKGVELTDPSTSGTDPLKIASKDVAPNKISEERLKIKPEVERSSDGKASRVKMGSHEIKRLEVPANLKEELKKNNPGKSDKELEEMEGRIKIGIERNNAILDHYASMGDIEMVDVIPGADVNTKEGRDKITKEYPDKIAKVFAEKFGENPTKAEKDLLEDIKKLSNIEDSTEFEKTAIEIVDKMSKIDSIRKGSSDLAESMVYMTMVKQGKPTYLPASANFKVADVVAFPDMTGLDPADKDYAKKLSSNMEYIVSLETQGGVSVKKDGGAASAGRAKNEGTIYGNPETQGKLTQIFDNYESIMGTTKRKPNHKDAEAKLNEIKDWAKKTGLWDGKELSAGKTVGSSKDWAEKQVKTWMDKGDLKGTPEHIKLVTRSLELHAEQALLLATVYNADCKGQHFGNVNMDTRKGKLDITDGINTASLMEPLLNSGYKFNEDSDGNVWPVPINVYAGRMLHSKWNQDEDRFVPGSH